MFLPGLPDRASALFIDFDDTRVDIAPGPDAVAMEPPVRNLLVRISGLLCGAVAVISGRPLTEIDQFETVPSLGGVAVSIGEGDTLAAHRLPDPASMRDWLARAADHLAGSRVERAAP